MVSTRPQNATTFSTFPAQCCIDRAHARMLHGRIKADFLGRRRTKWSSRRLCCYHTERKLRSFRFAVLRHRRFPSPWRYPRVKVAAHIAGATSSATSQRSNGNTAKDPYHDLRCLEQHSWILVGSIGPFRTLNTWHFQHLDGRHIETLLLQGLGKSLRDIAVRIGQGGHFGKHLCHPSCGCNNLITNPHCGRHRNLHSQSA